LKDSGLLNDQRFADSYAAARLENQGFGKMRVLRDLRQRRVTANVAEQAVQQVFQDTDEVQLVEQYLARKFRGKDLPAHFSEPKNVMSAFRRLRNAGFSSGAAIRVLKRYAAQADELAESEDAAEPHED
jgi:regulatory protein